MAVAFFSCSAEEFAWGQRLLQYKYRMSQHQHVFTMCLITVIGKKIVLVD